MPLCTAQVKKSKPSAEEHAFDHLEQGKADVATDLLEGNDMNRAQQDSGMQSDGAALTAWPQDAAVLQESVSVEFAELSKRQMQSKQNSGRYTYFFTAWRCFPVHFITSPHGIWIHHCICAQDVSPKRLFKYRTGCFAVL
jgi:hypothetical protein